MRDRTYSELRRIDAFEERYRYLALHGVVGDTTFGFDRYLNQAFYRSTQWRRMRDQIIVRDNGCDLGDPDHPIYGRVIIHHMNPITVNEVVNGEERILDPEFLICVSHKTHMAIHYGDESLLPQEFIERRPGDTTLWAPRRKHGL